MDSEWNARKLILNIIEIHNMMKQFKYRILKSSVIAATIIGLLGFSGCYYDDEANLYPEIGGCDISNVTYSGTIAQIMSDNCNQCHDGSNANTTVRTDNYPNLKATYDSGRLWGSVNHDSGFSFMPKDRPKLSDCDLSKIWIWIDGGALDN